MKVLFKLTAVALAFTLAFGTFGSVAFAKETPTTISVDNGAMAMGAAYSTRAAVGSCQIYSDSEKPIYYGIGRDQWIHISPWVTPAHYTIRMYEQGNSPIYTKTFTMTDATSHWYVGANVQRVTLQGTPGVVSVSSSDH